MSEVFSYFPEDDISKMPSREDQEYDYLVRCVSKVLSAFPEEPISYESDVSDLLDYGNIVNQFRNMSLDITSHGYVASMLEELLGIIDTPESDSTATRDLLVKKMMEVMNVEEDEICLLREYYEASDSSERAMLKEEIEAMKAELKDLTIKWLTPQQEERMQQMITAITQNSDGKSIVVSMNEYLRKCDDEIAGSLSADIIVLEKKYGKALKSQMKKMQALREQIVEQYSRG